MPIVVQRLQTCGRHSCLLCILLIHNNQIPLQVIRDWPEYVYAWTLDMFCSYIRLDISPNVQKLSSPCIPLKIYPFIRSVMPPSSEILGWYPFLYSHPHPLLDRQDLNNHLQKIYRNSTSLKWIEQQDLPLNKGLWHATALSELTQRSDILKDCSYI